MNKLIRKFWAINLLFVAVLGWVFITPNTTTEEYILVGLIVAILGAETHFILKIKGAYVIKENSLQEEMKIVNKSFKQIKQ